MGAIIGPHGTGKSTLLSHLVPRCFSGPILSAASSSSESEASVAWVQLRRGQNVGFCSLPPILREPGICDWILDGFEQLWLHQKLYVHWRQWMRGGKLLITAHRRQPGVPVIYRTESSPELARDLVSKLLQASLAEKAFEFQPESIVELEALVFESWRRHGGNIREVFMDLYDRVGNGSKLRIQQGDTGRIGT